LKLINSNQGALTEKKLFIKKIAHMITKQISVGKKNQDASEVHIQIAGTALMPVCYSKFKEGNN